MDQAAPSGATRRRGCRHWKRWLAVLCAMPPLGFALSNLWLASPWGGSWLAAKIQRRCGLETRVGGASWSPWNGVTVREVVISQPAELQTFVREPLARIVRLRFTPVWRSWLHGRLAVRDVTIESPRVVLSVEMVSRLAQQAAMQLAAVAAAEPPMPPIATLQPGAGTPTPGTPNPAQPGSVQAPNPQAPETRPPPSEPATPASETRAPQTTSWIRLHHASFLLVSSASRLPLVEVVDLTSEVPVSGKEAHSSLNVGGLKCHGLTVLDDFEAPLEWRFPVLSLAPQDVTVEGINLQVAGKIALAKGLPLQVEMQVPGQSPAVALPGGGNIKARQLAASGRFRGLLLSPASWQGEALAQGAAIDVATGGHAAVFDNATCLVALRGGVLSCVDARAVGDELSLLGNATLFADGRAAGVMRVVAAPEAAAGIVKRFFPRNDAEPGLTPLNTPQRAACDLEVFGSLNALSIRLGQNGPVMPLP